LNAPRKRFSMPKEKRNSIVKKYVRGVVVVQVVNHNVTRVPEEKVVDMPGIGGMELADDTGIPVEDGDDMSMFISMLMSMMIYSWTRS
jgi:hypothetical protein